MTWKVIVPFRPLSDERCLKDAICEQILFRRANSPIFPICNTSTVCQRTHVLSFIKLPQCLQKLSRARTDKPPEINSFHHSDYYDAYIYLDWLQMFPKHVRWTKLLYSVQQIARYNKGGWHCNSDHWRLNTFNQE